MLSARLHAAKSLAPTGPDRFMKHSDRGKTSLSNDKDRLFSEFGVISRAYSDLVDSDCLNEIGAAKLDCADNRSTRRQAKVLER